MLVLYELGKTQEKGSKKCDKQFVCLFLSVCLFVEKSAEVRKKKKKVTRIRKGVF